MKNLIEKYLKSAWIPYALFLLIILPGIILTNFLPNSIELFYTDKRTYLFWKNVGFVFNQTVFFIACSVVLFSFIYKIKNKLWRPLLGSIAILLLCYLIHACLKRGVNGRLTNIEEIDYDMRSNLNNLADMLEHFKKEKGYYPDTLADIDKGEIYNDFSGAPFQYYLSDDKKSFQLKGAGYDKKLGTFDDIVWKAPELPYTCPYVSKYKISAETLNKKIMRIDFF